jgi:hypothetical protein
MLFLQAIEYLKAVEAGHPDIEQNQVRLELGDARQDFATRGRLADDLDVGMRLERQSDRLEDESVVVHQK